MATVNPPSPAIRISNLARDACREDIIRNRFGAYGRVETVKYNKIIDCWLIFLLELPLLKINVHAQ